nr:hypothetical protein [Bacillus paranthracis]
MTFTDLIPNGTTFITDSVTIGGITQIGLNLIQDNNWINCS